MKITLNSLEWAGLAQRKKEWESKTGYKASNEFLINLLSQVLSENLDTAIDQVLDIKERVRKEEKLENASNTAMADKQ